MDLSDRRPVVVDVADPDHLDAALRYAAAEAATHACGIRLVRGTGTPTSDGIPRAAADPDHRAREVLQRAVECARLVVGERTPVTSELFHGPAASAVSATSRHARLVVLQRGDYAAPCARAGRPACDELAVRSHAPVAVVSDLWTGGTPPGSLVTLGLDAPRRRPELVREAVALAQARRAVLRVVHAWWSPLFRSDLRVNSDRADHWEAAAGEVLAAALATLPEDPRISVELQVVHGRPAEVLAAASRSSCLLVVGRGWQEQPRVGLTAGPVAATLAYDASCPVVLVPTGLEVPGAPAAPAAARRLRRAGQPA